MSVGGISLLEVDSHPLFLSQIREFVDGQLVGFLGGVRFSNHFPVLDENSESEILDHLVGVSLVVHSLPELELFEERFGERVLQSWGGSLHDWSLDGGGAEVETQDSKSNDSCK